MNLDKFSDHHYNTLEDYLDAAEYVSNDEPIENLFGRKKKKRKGRLKKIFNKIKDGVKKVAKKMGNAAKFAILLPLMPAMIAVLKAKGKRVPKSIEDISQAFYTAVINKSYSDEWENFSPGEKMAFEPATISIIVQAVIKFFKNLKKRKKEGKKLTGTEAIALGSAVVETAKVAMAAEQDLKNESRKIMSGMTSPKRAATSSDDNGDSGGMQKMIPIILAAVAVLFFLKK